MTEIVISAQMEPENLEDRITSKMPLSSRDKGITKFGGENFPEQILRLPMVFFSDRNTNH